MSELSLSDSLARASVRLRASTRRRRSDAGASRLPAAVESRLQELLASRERPTVADVLEAIQAHCRRLGLRPPSRATVYNAMERVEPPLYEADELPEAVRRCLHNVESGLIPGHQVAFAAFNYGDTRAMSFAAGMPWSCLFRAARMHGFRPKSLGLLRAIMSFRGM